MPIITCFFNGSPGDLAFASLTRFAARFSCDAKDAISNPRSGCAVRLCQNFFVATEIGHDAEEIERAQGMLFRDS
ncbi:hypothetical protein [Oryzibacter oryziterrae]|uniref:hypothetical protein n=1 Tax=Oryzibacter oryziterrae TaxID=2766474 RepID=UPI001F23A072|nr:hypothetical protein [Oryzibacter oryziterrae]